MSTLQVNPTFGVSQQVEIPPAPVIQPPAPAVNLQQVYDPNSANIINGNEAGVAAAQATSSTNPFDENFNIGAGGANPFLNHNTPDYNAIAHSNDKNKSADNPNGRLASQVNNPKTKKDPKAEINQGGTKSHTITNNEISELESQTNLTLYPYLFGGELARIRHQFSGLDKNKYYLLLNMLVYGFDNKILQSGAYGNEKCVIDQAFLDDFLRMSKIPQLQEIIKKTPAYAKGSFEELSKLGTTQANASHLNENPITGPSHDHPNLLTALMEKIHPNAVAELEAHCNKVRTNAYLSLPKRAFGSLQHLVSSINKVIASFAKIISDIYNGMLYYIRQFFMLINGVIAKIQQLIMLVIESIIPLDLICLIAMILGKAQNDIPFFSSIMSMSNIMNQFNGSFDSYISKAMGGSGGGITGFANNPFAAVSRFLPPQINQIVGQVNALQSNPDAFLASAITNFGYATAAKQTQGQVLNVLTQKLGSNFAAMHPIASFLGANGAGNPETPTAVGPTVNKDGKNVYGQPLSSSGIKSNTPGGGVSESVNAGLANSGFSQIQAGVAAAPSPVQSTFMSGINPAANFTGTQ